MKIDRRKNLKFSEWAPEFGTLDSDSTKPGGTETPIWGISSSELHNNVSSSVTKAYAKHKQCSIMLKLLQPKEKHTSALTVIDRDHISLILQERHDCPYMGHMSEDRTKHQGKSPVNHRRLTSRFTMCVMSHLPQENINHHMCHMRMSLKAQNHFSIICNFRVITPHGATQHMLTRLHPPPDETLALPPSLPSPLLTLPHPLLIFSSAYNPYAPAGPSSYACETALIPPYASLHPPNPMRCLPSLCLWSAFLTCL
ncbi:hypothetical protein O181_072893 [Austropuccinia psidii MF-1]|uniref:Uncharacterized protein n=1 Tax=Austropuccinia psidii MF-1 TaxID=1389203 RepID=A0A9Q3F3W2_9BASI|nr:hypothetical protein [Austropuccinia psidii MF-1]